MAFEDIDEANLFINDEISIKLQPVAATMKTLPVDKNTISLQSYSTLQQAINKFRLDNCVNLARQHTDERLVYLKCENKQLYIDCMIKWVDTKDRIKA